MGIHSLLGQWREAFQVKQEAISLLNSLPDTKFAKARIFGRWSLLIWIGQWASAEREFQSSIAIVEAIKDDDLLDEASKRLGWVLSLQGRHAQAQEWFSRSKELASRLGENGAHSIAVTLGFQGLGLLNKDTQEACRHLQLSLDMKKAQEDHGGIQEILNGLGVTSEDGQSWVAAETYYRESQDLRWVGRRYFDSGALTGLVRVKHAQGDYAAIAALLTEAEQLAQQYEYNDHLTSLRLTQGHIAWDGHIPEWGNGSDGALRYYQHALTYALRYNRFLLDEALSGRPQGTPLRPIIPHCLERGEEGRRMLIALSDWWQTGLNDIGTPRLDTISPIPEGIPLLEAERIAREREPGDGSPQRTVLEQIDAALSR